MKGRLSEASVAKGSLWNLTGLVLPLLAAIAAVPPIVAKLGVERFGVLALTWAVVGAASMLDLGVGRALTQAVAKRNASGDVDDLVDIVWTAVIVLAILGSAAGMAFFGAAPWLANQFFNVGPDLAADAERAMIVLGFSLPFVLASAALQGVLDGCLRFDLANLVRIPLSASNYLIPLAIVPFTVDLGWIVGATVLGRVLACVAYGALVRRILAGRRLPARFRVHAMRPLFALGGWMTASSIVATAIVYLDRFVIGALGSMSAVGYYATPYELVSRLALVPGAIGSALLPIFASYTEAAAREEVERAFARGLRYVVLLVFPATMLMMLFARQGLAFWLNEQFAQESARIAQILAAGIFVNSLAIIPLIFLYGAGRADAVARVHLAELPLYALLLWELVARWGGEGAAVAWTIRVIVDAGLLFVIARKLYPNHRFRYARVALALFGGLAALLVGMLVPSLTGRILYAVCTLGAFAFYGWTRLLTATERGALRRRTNAGRS